LILVLEILLFVGGSVVVTFACYFAARVVLHSRGNEHTRDLSSSVVFRLSALHGLILALVFAQELLTYNGLRESTNREANLVEAIHFDLKRFGVDRTGTLQRELARYAKTVLEQEWSLLATKRQLSDKAWSHREAVLKGVLALQPKSPAETWLRSRMLQKLASLEDERNRREIAAITSISDIFWVVALVGLALVSASFFSYTMSVTNVALLCFFAVYTGIVLFVINAIDDPFSAPGRIDPAAFQRLFDTYLKPNV